MFIATGRFAEAPGSRPVHWAATGRFGGVSEGAFASLNLAAHVGDDPIAVQRNRDAVRQAVGASALAVIQAVHGARIRYVSQQEPPAPTPSPPSHMEWSFSGPGGPEKPPFHVARRGEGLGYDDLGYDGLVTDQAGIALLALGADCAMLALAGERAIAVVHCGWQGLVADAVGAAVAAVRALDDEVRAGVLSAAICGACYPVPADRVAAVQHSLADGPGVLVACDDGQVGIDVRAGVLARLEGLGVGRNAIEALPGCTYEDSGYFSYRRDGVTGRNGLVAMIAPAL